MNVVTTPATSGWGCITASLTRIYYELKLMLGVKHLIVVGLLAVTVFGFNDQIANWLGRGEHVLYARAFVEMVVPLLATLGFGHILSIERQVGMGEIEGSYPAPNWITVGLRTLLALTLIYMATGVALWLLDGAFLAVFSADPFTVAEAALRVIKVSLPPTLFLLGLTWAVGTAISAPVGAGVAVGYWFFNSVNRGELTGVFYLYQATFPNHNLQWEVTRWGLLLGGLALSLAAAAVRSRQWLAN